MTETKISYKNIESIEEGNKLIADFMGWESKYHPVEQIHSSWDWLMPVVEKIESQVDYIEIYLEKEWGIEVKIYYKDILEPLIRVHEKCAKIEAVFMAVVEFIKYLYKNK